MYEKLMKIDTSTFYGSGKRKTTVQKHYEKFSEYLDRLKQYSHHIKTYGENRALFHVPKKRRFSPKTKQRPQ